MGNKVDIAILRLTSERDKARSDSARRLALLKAVPNPALVAYGEPDFTKCPYCEHIGRNGKPVQHTCYYAAIEAEIAQEETHDS